MHSQRFKTLQSSEPPSPPSEFWLDDFRHCDLEFWGDGKGRALTRDYKVGLRLSWRSLLQLLKLLKMKTLQKLPRLPKMPNL